VAISLKTKYQISRELGILVQTAKFYAQTIAEIEGKYAAASAEVQAEVSSIIVDAGLTLPSIVQEKIQAETLVSMLGPAVAAYNGDDEWPAS